MLLLHQSGSVKVGEVVRYKITYTPSLDIIVRTPGYLFVKVKNTSAIPLRAAYLRGPYTLYVSGYPSTFDPNVKFEQHEEEGEPDYEPQLKAGGHWSTKLKVPVNIQQSAENAKVKSQGQRPSFTWIIEIASQILFSRTAAVHFELLVGRDEQSVHSGLSGAIQMGSGQGLPGKLEDVQKRRSKPIATEQTSGVFSKAIKLIIDDTETLWNSPPFPSYDDKNGTNQSTDDASEDSQQQRKSAAQKNRSKQKKIHLVILTHGLHSNLGADMLYMKESIDAAAKQARQDAKARKEEMENEKVKKANEFGRQAANLRSTSAPDLTQQTEENLEEDTSTVGVEDDDDDDGGEEEEVVIRGFNGNAVKTERGIQYLGKRLAKYVLTTTYPGQPYLPVKSSLSKTLTRTFSSQKLDSDPNGKPTHKNSSIVKADTQDEHSDAYRISSISFIGHSLGGLIQTYAIAYIQKHSPDFFDRIKPINFVALATPFLGLSNENPMYVKFALDFGLVGRTGQDLGLTWRAPTIARNSWGAMINGFVNDPHKDREPDPGSKPLLRILPTGPAHQALGKFRNRTVYSNVVNDGIVPLRTSCLLFLDWRGLERVEKARRENGLVGTMVNWGWNEVTGQNVTAARKSISGTDVPSDGSDSDTNAVSDPGSAVPHADASQGLDYYERAGKPDRQSRSDRPQSLDSNTSTGLKEDAQQQEANFWTAFWSFVKPQAGSKPRKDQPRSPKIYRRAQTMKTDDGNDGSNSTSNATSPQTSEPPVRKGPVRGSSLYTNNSGGDGLEAPPRTSVFEAAGDLLNPPLPPREFLLDPAARPRTIFHDRVYHPDDIPAPPPKRAKTFMRLNSSRAGSQDNSPSDLVQDESEKQNSPIKNESPGPATMKIEEKIARAYHKDMSWRKVLVRLEPDAHNNLIVRRMFANAYGWPVVKHLVDTHFAFTAAATTRDENEPSKERAKGHDEAVGEQGEQVKEQVKPPDDHTLQPEENKPQRNRSTDGRIGAEVVSPSDDRPIKRHELRTLQTKFTEQERLETSRDRSSSEFRESRDELPDLVSMITASGETSSSFGAMHSGHSINPNSASAALQRLQRKDSARWSDRYFEGTDDDDSSTDEETVHQRELAMDVNSSVSSTPPKSSLIVRDGQTIVQEPGKMSQQESILNAAGPVIEVNPNALNIGGSIGGSIGLGTNVAERISSPTKDNNSDDTRQENQDQKQRPKSGIAEQVATAHGQNS